MKRAKITRKASEGTTQRDNRKNRRSRTEIKLVDELENEKEEAEDEEVKLEDDDESDVVLENNENSEENAVVLGNSESDQDSDDGENDKKETKPTKRRRKRLKYNAAEEARLERLVFGDPSDVINNLLQNDKSSSKDNEHAALYSRNVNGFMKDSEDSDSDNIQEQSGSDEESNAPMGRNAAWFDDDDVDCSVNAALKAQHRKLPCERPEKVYTEFLENKFSQIVGTPKWASLNAVKDEDEDSDNEILKHSSHLAVEKVTKLRKGKIDIKVMTDINKSTHTEGPVVTSLEFHPTSTVALVAGLSGVLSLFQIDGRENNKLHSLQFDKFRINCAKFLKEGTEVILGSRNHSHSQAYDLMSGKTYKIPLPHGITNMKNFEVSPDGKFIAVIGRMGQIHLLSAATKELVANIKMNKRCLALAFTPDSTKLISHGEILQLVGENIQYTLFHMENRTDSEEMYIWDLKTQSCLHKAIDDGCIASAALAFSPSGQFIATGSKQGVVNIYDAESVFQKRNPNPLKIILNLTTPITSLKFNPTSEILAMASNLKENALKMVHIPSFTVFDNFPTFQTKMYNPFHLDFSPSSGYLGLSNNKGHAYLYRLKHFGNY